MLELRRAESVDVDVRIFLSDVMEQVDIPIEPELGMMAALHQDLHPAGRGQFIEFLVDLLASQDVMVVVLLGAIKRAELAIDVADVGVIDVAIDDISHDLAPAAVVVFLLRQIAPRIGQRPHIQRAASDKAQAPPRPKCVRRREFFLQRFFLERDHPNAI